MDLVTATGPGAGRVRAFALGGESRLAAFSPLGATFDSGLFVAAILR